MGNIIEKKQCESKFERQIKKGFSKNQLSTKPQESKERCENSKSQNENFKCLGNSSNQMKMNKKQIS